MCTNNLPRMIFVSILTKRHDTRNFLLKIGANTYLLPIKQTMLWARITKITSMVKYNILNFRLKVTIPFGKTAQ
jgi:hypothetical protein